MRHVTFPFKGSLKTSELNQRFADIAGGSILQGFRLKKGTGFYSVSISRDGAAESVLLTKKGVRLTDDGESPDAIRVSPNMTAQDRYDVIYVIHESHSPTFRYEIQEGVSGEGVQLIQTPELRTAIGYVRVRPNQTLTQADLTSYPLGLRLGTQIFEKTEFIESIKTKSLEIEGKKASTEEFATQQATTEALAKAQAALDDSKTYTNGKLDALIGSAPGTLDTLKEIADALGNDAQLSSKVIETRTEVTNARGAFTSLKERMDFQKYYVNVKEFGAKGDGVTDDTAAIQAAIDASSSNNAIIHFPEGTFICGTVVVSAPTQIKGSGKIIKKSGSSGVFNVVGDDVELEGLTIQSNNYATDTGYLIKSSGKRIHVNKCIFNKDDLSKEYTCVRLVSGSVGAKITDNFLKNGAFMIMIEDGAKNILISRNYFTGGSTKGIVTAGVFSTEPVGDAIKMTKNAGGDFVKIIHNVFDTVYRDCVDMFSAGTNIDFSHNICRDTNVLVADIKTIYRDAGDPFGTSDHNNPTRDITMAFNDVSGGGLGTFEDAVFSVRHNPQRTDNLYKETIYATQRVHLFGNKINSAVRFPFYISKCKNISILKNEVKGAIERAMYIEGSCEDIDVEQNEIFVTSNISPYYGVSVSSSTAKFIRVTNNKIYGVDNFAGLQTVLGIVMQGTDCKVFGNYIRNVTTGVSASLLKNSQIAYNVISLATTAGLRIGESGLVEKTTVKNNEIRDSLRGILFGNAPSKIIFSDNLSLNCPTPWSNDTTLLNSLSRNNDVLTV